ncbi:MAG TPA: DUF2243 domain-containing protein [Thermoleophilaceae bacterium]
MRWTRERVGYLTFGVGTGALVDGILLHQVLQWHHLVSSKTSDGTLRGLEDNTLADGIFHIVFLAVLLAGAAMFVGRRLERRPFLGLLLVGWGLFHVADQLLFHLALGAHHIREGVENYELYDWGFFAIGLALVTVGALIQRDGDLARTR